MQDMLNKIIEQSEDQLVKSNMARNGAQGEAGLASAVAGRRAYQD
jgi:hypothetical protein